MKQTPAIVKIMENLVSQASRGQVSFEVKKFKRVLPGDTVRAKITLEMATGTWYSILDKLNPEKRRK